MSIEGGPSGAVGVVSVGFGSVNEGPVRGSLEGFRPMNISDISTIDKGGTIAPLGEIVFNAPATTPPQDGEGLGAPVWKVPESAIVPSAVLQVEPVILPGVVGDQSTSIHPHLGMRRVVRQTEAVYAPAIEQQLFEEVAEEEVITENNVDEQNMRITQEEEIIKVEKSYLVDQPVLAQVLSEADQAVEKAEAEAERLGLGRKILGYLVARFMPDQHPGNTGGAVKDGIDGTIPARKESIEAKEAFASRKEVEAKVLEIRPVTIGENGEQASQGEVRTTFREHIVKPLKPRKIFEKRVIRRQILAEKAGQRVIYEEIKPEVAEPTIEDNPDLAEALLPKAA
ncbi:MAG: hypothetical protein G01um10147_1109 [Microgenomates group bacterium Gr01-1014_7]|nr:MAG: hypothetical protein G01um10147_1109 [Microgenomates group bacterium Gr01-1014_7]